MRGGGDKEESFLSLSLGIGLGRTVALDAS